MAAISGDLREAYVRECVAAGRRVGIKGFLRFVRERESRNRVRDEAQRRLQTTITSALRGLDRSLRLAPDQAVELCGCRDRLKRQLAAVPLVDVIERSGRSGDDLVKPFEALLSGAIIGRREAPCVQPLRVLAVLDRTAVVCPLGRDASSSGERSLARLTELFVDEVAIRWTAKAEERHFGHDGFTPHSRRRCPRCHREEGEVQFRAYRTSYCVECAREVAREQRLRQAGERESTQAA